MEFDGLLKVPFAHRGLYDQAQTCPENSLASVKKAVGCQFGIEIDVCLTLDEQVIVFHDDDFFRMTGNSSLVSELCYERIKTFVLGRSKEKIPLLSDVLQEVSGRVPLLIELKSFDKKNGFHTDVKLETRVVEIVEKYSGFIALKSFNPISVKFLKGLSRKYPVGFLSCNYATDSDFIFASGVEFDLHKNLKSDVACMADFISYNIHDLNESLVQSVKSQYSQKPILVWTVRTHDDFAQAKRLADNIVFEWAGVRPLRFSSNDKNLNLQKLDG